MDPIWQQINEAIHRRNTESVNRLIPKYLKFHRSSSESLYEASEFYRKITDYRNALRLLPKMERTQASASKVSEADTKLELQLARLLNLLGASNYALRIVERIRAEGRAKSKIEMVEIYHCNYKYAEVVTLLGSDYPIPESEPWHQDWLLHIYLSQALAELKHTDLAIARMERMRGLSASPLIQAIALCFKGKFHMTAGEPDKALPSLLESQLFFEDNDQTADHAILQTLLGECFLELRKFQEAEKALKKALKILFRPGLKPEEWIEIPLLLERIPGHRKLNQRLAPRLRAAYGPDYSPLRIADREHLGKEDQIFSLSKIEAKRKKRHFDRTSDTAWSGQKARLGLDLVDDLICNLVYAGEYGIPQFRLYELLWPNEPFSFDQHQKRLEDVVGRARVKGYKVSWNDLHLRLMSTDVTATGRPERLIRGHSFLLKYPVFTRTDVQRYFSISSAGARALCRDWLQSGLVALEKAYQYRAIKS